MLQDSLSSFRAPEAGALATRSELSRASHLQGQGYAHSRLAAQAILSQAHSQVQQGDVNSSMLSGTSLLLKGGGSGSGAGGLLGRGLQHHLLKHHQGLADGSRLVLQSGLAPASRVSTGGDLSHMRPGAQGGSGAGNGAGHGRGHDLRAQSAHLPQVQGIDGMLSKLASLHALYALEEMTSFPTLKSLLSDSEGAPDRRDDAQQGAGAEAEAEAPARRGGDGT
jgi:hypothetical protein